MSPTHLFKNPPHDHGDLVKDLNIAIINPVIANINLNDAYSLSSSVFLKN